jgi:hypothetical protein
MIKCYRLGGIRRKGVESRFKVAMDQAVTYKGRRGILCVVHTICSNRMNFGVNTSRVLRKVSILSFGYYLPSSALVVRIILMMTNLP